jgi:CRISPR/Cas system-associated endoribonuclease Cas2
LTDEGKAFRVQKGYLVTFKKSAFECRLDNTKSDKMAIQALHIFDPNSDSLRVY